MLTGLCQFGEGLYWPSVVKSSNNSGTFHPISYLHIPIQFFHNLLLLLISYINFLHVVSEVHVLEGREFLALRNKNELLICAVICWCCLGEKTNADGLKTYPFFVAGFTGHQRALCKNNSSLL